MLIKTVRYRKLQSLLENIDILLCERTMMTRDYEKMVRDMRQTVIDEIKKEEAIYRAERLPQRSAVSA